MNGINDVGKDKFFKVSKYEGTRGNSMKLAKIQHRLKVQANILVSQSLTCGKHYQKV